MDASADCNSLTFTLSETSSVLSGRSWTVRVTQYDAGFENLAPAGCTQYFYDEEDADGFISSYNYNGGRHLADQNQVICIRREENKSKICYSVTDPTDIAISGKTGAGNAAASPNCGGYNDAGTLSYADALLIPSATAAGSAVGVSNFCGQGNGFVGATAGGVKAGLTIICLG